MIFSHLQGFFGCSTAWWYLRMHQLSLKLLPQKEEKKQLWVRWFVEGTATSFPKKAWRNTHFQTQTIEKTTVYKISTLFFHIQTEAKVKFAIFLGPKNLIQILSMPLRFIYAVFWDGLTMGRLMRHFTAGWSSFFGVLCCFLDPNEGPQNPGFFFLNVKNGPFFWWWVWKVTGVWKVTWVLRFLDWSLTFF